MEKLDNIERYAWWTIWNKKDIKPHYLTYKSGELTPTSNGYLKHRDGPKVDCEFPGTQIGATAAGVSPRAKIITCSGTGTKMIMYVKFTYIHHRTAPPLTVQNLFTLFSNSGITGTWGSTEALLHLLLKFHRREATHST